MNEPPLTFCLEPGCNQLTRKTRCDEHRRPKPVVKREKAYRYRWDQLSTRYRKSHPLCVPCLIDGFVQPSRAVDHIIPHGGNEELFNDWSNLCAICHSCHSRKTRWEIGIKHWVPKPDKYVICGLPGAGKTTLATTMSKQIDCDVYDMDHEAALLGIAPRGEGWTQGELDILMRERGAWIRSHPIKGIAIVARPLSAMMVASAMQARVIHVTCNEDERMKRLEERQSCTL